MSTAPKDGTDILVCIYSDALNDDLYIIETVYYETGHFPGWVNHDRTAEPDDKFDGWMPMPPPPTVPAKRPCPTCGSTSYGDD